MSKNIFKTNSRFDVLMDDYNNNNNNKSNKNNKYNNEKQKKTSNQSKFQKETKQLNKQEYNKREKNENPILKKNMTEENFPQLIVKQKNIKEPTKQLNKEETKINYIDKLNTSKQITAETIIEEEKVEPGWVKLEKNKITKAVTIKYGKKTYFSDDEKIVTPTDVLYNLIKLHEQRKNDYIRDWGEESYENTFRFINYDYDYFEKLDEEYDIAQIDEEYVSDEELEYYY
jgi:hypothetical protein